ncbi:MAG: LEA type 2 family protein [Acidobacteria bacterium]|nr:LEA type 2 family protein [Acidobacteriota bacterium]
MTALTPKLHLTGLRHCNGQSIVIVESSFVRRTGIGLAASASMFKRVWPLPLLLLAGCSTLLNLKTPEYSLRSITTTPRIAIPLRESTIDFDFLLEIRNPNGVALTLDQIDLDVFLNNRQVTNTVSSHQVKVPANGIGDARLSTSVDYESIRSLFNEIVRAVERGETDYELRGRAWFQTPLGRMNFPINVRGTERL